MAGLADARGKNDQSPAVHWLVSEELVTACNDGSAKKVQGWMKAGVGVFMERAYRGENYFRGFFFGRPKLGGGGFGTAP